MTDDIDRQLTRVLTQAAEQLPDHPDLWAGVQRAHRRQRRRRAAGVAGLTAVVVAAIVAPLTLLPGPSHQAVLTAIPTPIPAASGRPADRVVSYRHVTVAVPPGWTTGQPPLCAPVAEHVVTIGPFNGTAACPVTPDVASGIGVVFYDQNASTSSPPTSTRWAGQPAQTISSTHTVRELSGNPVTLTTDTVYLPLLGAQVTAQARTPAEAAALLSRVSAHPATTLALPSAASSLKVSVIATSRPSHQPDVTTSQQAAISAVLQALRTAPLLPTSTPICNTAATLPVALLTIPGRPTIQVRLGGCDEIVAGNGTLARATPQLKASLAAIVGDAALG